MGLSGSLPFTGQLAEQLVSMTSNWAVKGLQRPLLRAAELRYGLGSLEQGSLLAVRYELNKRLYLKGQWPGQLAGPGVSPRFLNKTDWSNSFYSSDWSPVERFVLASSRTGVARTHPVTPASQHRCAIRAGWPAAGRLSQVLHR